MLAIAAAAAALLAAAPAARAAPAVAAYRGFGTWIDIYSTRVWSDPAGTARTAADHGVQTIFVQTGNYRQAADVVRRGALSQLVDAAHAAGMRVVAWYLPSFTNLARDLRRSLAAVRFRTASGQRFDSFALDIESSAVRSPVRRTARLLALSRALRSEVGARYPLGAIIPSPRGMELRPSYWPRFPYRQLDGIYDVFAPMAYYTYHVHGERAVRDDVARAISLIREQTGDPRVPIHVIGGIAGTSTRADVRGFMRAVAQCRPLGYSLYDYAATKPAAWTLLARPPRFPDEPC